MTRKAALLAAATLLSIAAQRGEPRGVPTFEVDPFWPRPLPNHWILGSVTGVAVDAQDHVWLVHRGMDSLTARTEAGLATNPPTAETCCAPAPPVLEFDQAGNLVGHWGGRGSGFDWPRTPGGIHVDSKGGVWITATAADAAAANEPPLPHDAHVLKFSRTGTFVMQIGRPGGDLTGLNRPASAEADTRANELYVADGIDNRRVAVFDATTGKIKRQWGAGVAQAATSKPFQTVSCVRVAQDGKVYVCDRKNNRIQVFQKDGKFLQEAFVSKTTLGEGSVWDIAFSPDAEQRFMYVADGADQTVWVLRRGTLAVIANVGAGGRWPGHFYGVGSMAVDSKGNLYTGETYEGKRVQKFTYKGIR
jgi:DNA-binding beta-propeller fold protein YncE